MASYADEPIRKQFEQFCGSLLRYMIDNPQHFRFMDQFHASPFISLAARNEGAEAFATYINVLMRGQEQGIIKKIGIEELMQFLNGGLMGFVRWVLTTGKPLTDSMLDNQLRIAWDAIKE